MVESGLSQPPEGEETRRQAESDRRPAVCWDGLLDSREGHLCGRLIARSVDGLNSRMTWSFDEQGAATRVTLRVVYALPPALRSTVPEATLIRENERDIDGMLANLKERIEREAAQAG